MQPVYKDFISFTLLTSSISLHWMIFNSFISSLPPSKSIKKALTNRRPEMENRTEKISAKTPQGQSWMLSLFECFLRKTFFILQIIMKTSHPSPKGNFFINIHLSCNFSVRKYVLACFSWSKSITFHILERETPTRSASGSLFGSVICQMLSEAVFWLVCML